MEFDYMKQNINQTKMERVLSFTMDLLLPSFYLKLYGSNDCITQKNVSGQAFKSYF